MQHLPCLCDGRNDIRCDESHCDIAGPGEPGNPNQCRICWLRLQAKRIQDEGWAVINLDAGGIGDALLGLTAVAAFRQQHPQTPIDYRVHAAALPFMELFDAGFDVLSVPGSGVTTHRINCRFDEEYSCSKSKCAVPRWLRYCNCIGVDAPLLPVLRDREALLAKGSSFRGVVALAPFASWRSRIYPFLAEVEKLLLSKGIRTVVFGEAMNRLGMYKGEKVARADAATLAAVMLNARCVIGPDTGLTHLSGIMGCPTVVLNGPTRGEDIHGFYPRVRSLSSTTLSCTGCYWQSPYSEACESRCPALASIRPEDVVALALDDDAFPKRDVPVYKPVSLIRREPIPPLVSPQPRALLGDKVHNALSAVGITEERVSNWIGQPCGCAERRQKLNRLQEWAEQAMQATKDKALSLLGGLIGK